MISTNGNNSARIQVAEICERLQLSERAVYALLESHVIPSLRMRKRYLIGRHAYEEWEKDIGKRNTNELQLGHAQNTVTVTKYH